MIYTLMLGAPVRKDNGEFGKLTRIIVNNGIADQFVVDPSGLFTGPERVAPISDVTEATAEGITLNIGDVEWHGYNAYHLERYLVTDQAAAPSLMETTIRAPETAEVYDQPTTDVVTSEPTVASMAVVLTSHTRVGDNATLAGLVIDTGRPIELLLEGGGSIPYANVGILDEDHITLGPKPERLDDVTLPGSIGQDKPSDSPDA